MITKQELTTRLDELVERTPRGNAVVQRNPRELPRRLRVLLLAVDGTHSVRLYVHTLKGFGDVGELLVELLALGMVKLTAANGDPAAQPKSAQFSELNALLDDSRFDPDVAAKVMYGTTAPGSFDEMLRVAKTEVPEIAQLPPPAPSAPVSPALQKEQVESLFALLDTMRGERHGLKQQVAKMQRLRAAAVRLDRENQRLFGYVFGLGALCVVLLVALVVVCIRK